MFNRSLNGGSLFGNANTSTPTSTPTPAANTFPMPSKPESIFGSKNTGINASSPSPAGGLFNSNSQGNNNGGLFGKSNNSPSSSLFGNQNNNTAPQGTGNLFSQSNDKPQFSFGPSNSAAPPIRQTGTNSLFSPATTETKSSTLFSSSVPIAQTSGLFGNTQALPAGVNSGLTSGTTLSSEPTNVYASKNPYGINIGSGPIPISSMPASITGSLSSDKHISKPTSESVANSSSESRRTYSVSSTNSNFTNVHSSVPAATESGLIKKLSTRLQTGQKSSSTQGIFSPFHTRTWAIEDQATSSSKNAFNGLQVSNSVKNGVPAGDFSSLTSKNSGLSDMRKLKIDPTRSSAKKLRLFNGKPIQKKVHETESVGHDEKDVPTAETGSVNNSESYSNGSNCDRNPKLNEESTGENNTRTTVHMTLLDSGYWCSPPPDHLATLSPSQLMAVSGFVIGRKDYGYITFNYDVDLTAFASDFKSELFGKAVIFRPTKTVEVYPEESKKAPIGSGLNVPATITLEKVYPIDKKTKRAIKDAARFDEVQALVRKLKNMRNMEYISYNPFGGVWTFKVSHFSIWGLIDEEDAEVDENDLAEGKTDNIKERNLIYPKQRRGLAQSNRTQKNDVPGSFSNTNTVLTSEKKIQDDLLKLQDQSLMDLNRDPIVWNEEAPVEEKLYEPDVEEEDFVGLEAEPSLEISNDWTQQLKLAGSSLRSIFVASKDIVTQNNNELDMLFNEFNQGMKLERKIKKERRLESESFSHFSTDMSILKRYPNCEAGAKRIFLSSTSKINCDLISSVVTKHINLSAITERASNDYPQIRRNSLQFHDMARLCRNSDMKLWELCSILFDSTKISYQVNNESVKAALLKKEKHKALCSWVTENVRAEIDSKLETTTNTLDRIFLYLAKNDVAAAAKLAIKTQNGHLAILISLLGSNDGRIRNLAAQQLDKWSFAGRKVDPRIGRIYKLLTGNIYENKLEWDNLSSDFSWLVLLGLDLYYGKIDEDSLEDFIYRHIKLSRPEGKDIRRTIFQLFSIHTCPEKFIEEVKIAVKNLEKTFLWYFLQIMRFNKLGDLSPEINDKLTFELIGELRIAQLYKEAIFTACFLADDFTAKQQIDSIIFQAIPNFTSSDNDTLSGQLKIKPYLIYEAQALWDQYNGDFLSQTQNLLKARCFKAAEKVLITFVGPKLILNDKVSKSRSELQVLYTLLSKFPREQMGTWGEGLGVFENYLSLMLNNNYEEKLLDSLLDGLSVMFERNKEYKSVPVCCNVMSQVISSIMIEKHYVKINDFYRRKLLNLPLGSPEKRYLKNQLAGIN